MEEQWPSIVAARPEPGPGVETLPGPFDDPRALQILSTEHWGLLSARSLVYNESFARAGMFLTFLSASLVALALAGQAMAFDRAFLVLAAVLLAFDMVIGLATYGRMMDAAVDDLRSILAMNRIRNAYAQIAPGALPFLAGSIHDDARGVLATYGEPARRRSPLRALLHGMTTSNGMVATIVALVAGALGGDLAFLAGLDAGQLAAVAFAAFAVVFALLARHSVGTIRGFEASLESRFPTPPGA